MKIKYRPAGYTETVIRLGAKAGQAQASKEKAERAEAQIFRMEMAERERQARREDAMFAQQLSEEAFRRAQTWELEKIDTRSRNNFALEEFEHQTREQQRIMTEIRKEQEIQLKEDQIRSQIGKTITADDAEKALLQLRTGVPFYTQSKIAERGQKEAISDIDRIRAAKFLQDIEERKKEVKRWWLPHQWEKEPEITPSEKVLKAHFEKLIGGEAEQDFTVPSQGLPTPKTKAEYDAIPSGTKYIHPTLGERIKR